MNIIMTVNNAYKINNLIKKTVAVITKILLLIMKMED